MIEEPIIEYPGLELKLLIDKFSLLDMNFDHIVMYLSKLPLKARFDYLYELGSMNTHIHIYEASLAALNREEMGLYEGYRSTLL